MPNNYFRFKQFTIIQERSAFRIGTDGVLLGAFAEVNGRRKILDAGTGTGLIALMLAQRSDAEIVAIEPDGGSFTEASENVLHSKWAGRIQVRNCRLQDYEPEGGKFDLIVTNPPYFIHSLKNPDPVRAETRHNHNLSHKDILEGTGRLLHEDGALQLILPYPEGTVFVAEAQAHGFFCNHILKIKPAPAAGIKRLILTLSRKREKAREQFLTIETGKRHHFTDEYVNLTRDFYPGF